MLESSTAIAATAAGRWLALRSLARNASTMGVMRLASVRIAALASGVFAGIGAAAQMPPDASGAEPGVAARGAERPFWRLAVSPYTFHFSNDSNHRPVRLIGAERQRPDGYLLGAAYFSNSFGEPSGYAFFGRRVDHWYADRMFLYGSVGLLYGYKGEYAHKVPLNFHGFSPGAIVGLGWQLTPALSTQVNLLGTSGVMFQFSIDLR